MGREGLNQVQCDSEEDHVTFNNKFRYKASLEKIHYEPGRNLDKNMILRMAEDQFISKGEDLLITGSRREKIKFAYSFCILLSAIYYYYFLPYCRKLSGL